MSDIHGSQPPEPPIEPGSTPAVAPAAAATETATVSDGSETVALRKPRRPVIIAAVAGAVVLLLVIGGGSWAFTTLVLGKGQTVAASAVAFPASTVGWAEIAIDPSNDQKLQALQFSQKLTGLTDALDEAGVDLDLSKGTDTDLKKTIWDAIVSSDSSVADTLDYDSDIKPWLGSRIAVGLLPASGTEPQVIVAIEASDTSSGEAAVTTLLDKNVNDLTIGSHAGYVVVASKGIDLDAVYAKGTLDSNSDFSSAAAKAGEWGLVSGWTGPGFAATAAENASGSTPASAVAANGGSQFAVVRLVDGTLELSGSTTGVESGPELGDAGAAVDSLPASTTLAGSYGSLGVLLDYLLSDNDLAASFVDAYGAYTGSTDPDATPAENIAAARATVTDFFQSSFGLTFPDDIESLFGESLTVAVDSGVVTAPSGTSENPVTEIVGSGIAIVVTSKDAAATEANWNTVLDTYAAQVGGDLGVTVSAAGDRVIISAGTYADTLASGSGDLGSSERASTVLPDLAGATGVLYLDIPAALDTYRGLLGSSADSMSTSLGAFEGLSAIGLTSTRESDTSASYRLRISTEK